MNLGRPFTRLRRGRWSPRRVAYSGVVGLAVAWALAWGAHEHALPVAAADLSAEAVSQRFVVDASTGVFDLSSISVQPGEVVEFVLAGSAEGPHRFVLAGAAGASMDRSTDANGDTIMRVRVPETGDLAFFCAVPGHEGLHGSLIVESRG